MNELTAVVTVVHIVTAILMAWPYYALVAVNQRVGLGPPIGDRTDTYMENIIKNRTIPCFVFQATALVTGVALVPLHGMGWDAFLAIPVLTAKLVLLLLIGGLLGYVHVRLQPRIDALFEQAGGIVPPELAPRIAALRLRRKQLASVCLFVVLTLAMLGVQVWSPFPVWLTALLLLAIAAFTRRVYTSVTPFGWA